eukprot:scaffold267042_cov14-Tisochrysis_lutea.AAC.1
MTSYKKRKEEGLRANISMSKMCLISLRALPCLHHSNLLPFLSCCELTPVRLQPRCWTPHASCSRPAITCEQGMA